MGILSKFENKMEDGIEGAAGMVGRSGLSPVQITKKAEKQMRREKIVGAGKQYAPTLYTVLVSPQDDAKLSKYYPTLAGETETYLMARARETGYVMDGHPLVRFLADPELKRGKFDVVAEMVAANIIQQLRDDEMRRYGLPTRSQAAGNASPRKFDPRNRQAQPSMQPLQNLEEAKAREEAERLRMQQEIEQKRQQAELFARQALEQQQALDQQRQTAYDAGYDDGYGESAPSVVGSQVKSVPSSQSYDAQPAAAAASFAGGRGVDAVFNDGIDSSAAQTDVDFAANELQVYLYDEARDTAYNLTGALQTIGRESSNDIAVPDINISRVHAQICREPDGTWTVTDLNSTNGLFVNGQRVQSSPLRDADMITLGTSTLEFQLLG